MADPRLLTARQARAIAKILNARTCEEGCQAAGVSKACFYKWMRNETFRAEFERQRQRLVEAAFGTIAQNIEKAASVLVGLLDCQDGRLKRLAANDIIAHFLKHKELAEIEKRIEAIESHLQGS
jgi:hypothetical protein